MGKIRTNSAKNMYIKWHLCLKFEGYKILNSGVKPNWLQLNSPCLNIGLIMVQKVHFGFLCKRRTFIKHILFLLLIFSAISCQAVNKSELLPRASTNLCFTELAKSWDEAIPLGNGMIGALIWEKEGKLRFSLDRADVWDLRPMENLDKPEFSFKWVQKQVKNRNYKVVQEMFDAPYDQLPAPSKIPGAALEFYTKALGEVNQVSLTLNNAVCETRWKGGATLQTFVHASQPTGWFRFEKVPIDFMPVLVPPQYQKSGIGNVDSTVTGQDLQRLGYNQGKVVQYPNKLVYRQKGWNGFEYEVAVAWKYSGSTLTGAWMITSSFSANQGDKKAGELVSAQLKHTKYNAALLVHIAWWKDYWGKSAISLPDKVLEKQWYLEQYKFGSAARPDAPPITLQSVWTADNGKLPPWKGDFHHDLNTQLSYWPAYSANHLDLEEGFLNWLWRYRETFKKYTKTYFGTSGMNVPGVTTLAGEPMGGWIQYSFGPTVSAWLGHHFYLHWRYTMDREFLEKEAYPWIRDVAVFIDELSVTDKNGLKKLPLSSSPEIFNNSRQAWFDQTTNFDLGLVRWTFEKAAELATELGKTDDASKWRNALTHWPLYDIDPETGFTFIKGFPYNESHRHFSHLIAFHPLGLIDWSKGKEDQKIIKSTIETLDRIGPDRWCGFSYSWLGNLKARAFDGNGAAEALRTFSQYFCLKNSFHVNGDQSKSGKSKFVYRPFTLEGNFAFASGIQEMLLQSHTGTVKLFPAIPDDWKDVSFSKLRAEGAFLISSEMKKGEVTTVEILSEKGGEIKIFNPFKKEKIKCSSPFMSVENNLIISTTAGQTILLSV
jgi:alpha-L-fucosidase 2